MNVGVEISKFLVDFEFSNGSLMDYNYCCLAALSTDVPLIGSCGLVWKVLMHNPGFKAYKKSLIQIWGILDEVRED